MLQHKNLLRLIISVNDLMSVAIIILVALSPSCVIWAQPGRLDPQSASLTGSASSSTGPFPDHPTLQGRNPRYRVQPQDVLSISFPLIPEFGERTVTVQPDGYISIQGNKSVYVQEMTVPEIVEALRRAYAGTLHDPIINVDLLDFQKPFFLISGEVRKPGQYDLRHEMTVSEGIAVAGGFAPTAKTQIFLFHRISPSWVEVKQLHLKDILHGKNANEDAHLTNGDMIFVPEKFIAKFRKYVPYSFSGNGGTYLTP